MFRGFLGVKAGRVLALLGRLVSRLVGGLGRMLRGMNASLLSFMGLLFYCALDGVRPSPSPSFRLKQHVLLRMFRGFLGVKAGRVLALLGRLVSRLVGGLGRMLRGMNASLLSFMGLIFHCTLDGVLSPS